MATPADQRLLELLDKWLVSLDLHIKYCSLGEDAYWKVQPWVKKHQRPDGWILDLAKEKTLALRDQVQTRIDSGDATFSDALELMAFLANLVGSQNIERYIPIADPLHDRSAVLARAKPSAAPAAAAERKTAGKPARSSGKPSNDSMPQISSAAREQVIADAVRFTQWGRKWFEIAELISRMADRPTLPEVRRLLKDHKAEIEKAAGR
jgi:hypothetical protein